MLSRPEEEEAQAGRGLWERGSRITVSDSLVLGTVPGTQWALRRNCAESDRSYHQIWADSSVTGALDKSLYLVTYSPPLRCVPCMVYLLVSVFILFLWLVCFKDGMIKNHGNSLCE